MSGSTITTPDPDYEWLDDRDFRGDCEKRAEESARALAKNSVHPIDVATWRKLLPHMMQAIRAVPFRADDGKGEEGGIACGAITQRTSFDKIITDGANCFERAILGGEALERAALPWRIVSRVLPGGELHTLVQAWDDSGRGRWIDIPLDSEAPR